MSKTKGRAQVRGVVLRVLMLLCLAGAILLAVLAWLQRKPLMEAESYYANLQGQYGQGVKQGGDWQPLWEQYPGAVGWIAAPELGIDYPVMQGEDNQYYLNHLPDGRYNVVGSVFMDAQNDPLLGDPLTLVYAHHVGGGEMFSPLVNYRSQTFLEQHPTMMYYTPEKAYTVEIFAAQEVDGADGAFLWEYEGGENQAQSALWLEERMAASDIAGPRPQAQDSLLALVTCYSLREDAPRYIVYGILKEQ